MNKRNLKVAELRNLATMLLTEWANHKDSIRLTGKALYNLLGLKRTLERELEIIEETLRGLAVEHHAEPRQDGSLFIPEEYREEANKAFSDFGESDIEISYGEITLREQDNIPLPIFEALYDFVICANE